MTAQGEVGKPSGSAAFCFTRNSSNGLGVRLVGELESVLPGKLDDPVPSFRRADHAPQGRELSRREIAGGHAVGGDHEIRDQVLGAVRLLGLQPANRVAVEDRSCLQRLEAEGTVDLAKFFHPLCRPVLEPQVLVQPGTAATAAGAAPPSSHAATLL